MTLLYTETLDAEGFGAEFFLKPGQSVTYDAVTADLEYGTLSLEQSSSRAIWIAALDVHGAAVDDLVDDDGGAVAVSAVLKNETTAPLYFRAKLVDTDAVEDLAGSVDVSYTSRADAANIEDVVSVTDEGIEFDVPVTAPADSALGSSELTPGVGISGAAAAFATSVVREGGIIRTRIYIDIEGLNGGDAANDIIGADGAGVAYLGQVTEAVNGDIQAGWVDCAEVPTGSDPDVDLWSADEATGVEDTLITALTNEVQLTNGGDHTLARRIALIALPVANQYLYLTGGDTTAGAYTAGKFVIELIGLPVEA